MPGYSACNPKRLDRRVAAACLAGTLLFLGLLFWDLAYSRSRKEVLPYGEEEPPRRQLFPPDGYQVSERLAGELSFTWTPSGKSRVQVARDSGFTELVLDEALEGASLRGRALGPGNYYWRVIPGSPPTRNPAPDAPPFPQRRLVVVPSLVPPELELPQGSFTGRVDDDLVVILPRGREMRFMWKAAPEAHYYIFRLYGSGTQAEAGSRHLLATHFVEESPLDVSFDDYEEGLFHWSVQPVLEAHAGAARQRGHAETSSFTLRKNRSVILEYPPRDFEISWTDVMRGAGEFRWSLLGDTGRSRFYLSRNPNPRSGRALVSTGNPRRAFAMPPLSPGDYYWTIEAQGGDGMDVSAEEAFRFTVTPGPPLPAARGLSPENNHVFGPGELRGRATISFAWNRVSGANAYIFTLYQLGNNGTRRRIRNSEPLTRTSYILDNLIALDRGTFLWQVEAVYRMNDGAIGRRGLMAEHRFTLDKPP
ncbi:MAG: hypothetical protein LBI85_03835, partial [Spirochaetaceae bacterium]|nr:hypothetical protein [Spirochaetaceae bacterium]